MVNKGNEVLISAFASTGDDLDKMSDALASALPPPRRPDMRRHV